MKKALLALVILAVLVGGELVAAHLSGGAFPTFGLPLGGDRGVVRRQALAFLEDIQFKDYERAASYHTAEERETVDIPFLLQRLFVLKPEQLDLMEYEILFAKTDTSGDRARVKSRLKVKNLLNGSIRDQELMLYFHRDPSDGRWYMRLEDSLREAEKDPDKKG